MRALRSHYQNWNLASRIGSGTKAQVYRISDTEVAKFKSSPTLGFNCIQDDSSAVEALVSEFFILKTLREEGISVPETVGVFRVPLRTLKRPQNVFKPLPLPGLVLKYLDGILIKDAPEEKKAELHARAVVEVEKAIMKGFVPGNYNLYVNTLWTPENDKIYLMGFDGWYPKRTHKKSGISFD